MKRSILIVFLSLSFVLTGHFKVFAQQTGTRVKGANSAYKNDVIWFSQPHEITEIRLLLQEGKNELAVEKARAFIAGLKNADDTGTRQRRYYGLNALCAALTSTGKLKEAIDTCSRAVKLNRSIWHALNTRGTAYYVSGQIDLALKDYRKALSLVQGQGVEAEVDLIQHNIDLAEAKKNNSN